MEILEHLIAQVRDGLRVAAGLIAISCVRIKSCHNPAFQQIIRCRQRPLHFIVDNAAVDQRVLRLFNLIMPALLHQHLRIFQHIGIEHRIKVNVHQILEVLVVAAGHRIHGLIRVGHGI